MTIDEIRIYISQKLKDRLNNEQVKRKSPIADQNPNQIGAATRNIHNHTPASSLSSSLFLLIF